MNYFLAEIPLPKFITFTLVQRRGERGLEGSRMMSWGDKVAYGLCKQPDDQLGKWLTKWITLPNERQGHLRLPKPKLSWDQGPGGASCGGGQLHAAGQPSFAHLENLTAPSCDHCTLTGLPAKRGQTVLCAQRSQVGIQIQEEASIRNWPYQLPPGQFRKSH